MANVAYSVLEEYDSIETITAVLMDNTPLNTGKVIDDKYE